MRRPPVLALLVLVVLAGAACVPLGTPVLWTQSPTTFSVPADGFVLLGTFTSVDVTLDGEGVSTLSAGGGATCETLTRGVVSGSTVMVGCDGDPFPGSSPGVGCLAGVCEFHLEAVEPFDLRAESAPVEYGGTAFIGSYLDLDPVETTTTTSTTTTEVESSTTTEPGVTTTTVAPGPPPSPAYSTAACQWEWGGISEPIATPCADSLVPEIQGAGSVYVGLGAILGLAILAALVAVAVRIRHA